MEVEPKDLKTKSFANVQELFDKEMKRVNTFVDMDTELVGDSEKLDEKVEAEVDDAKEVEELKQCLEIVPDDGDDVTIDATPLSIKIPIGRIIRIKSLLEVTAVKVIFDEKKLGSS
ncbi:hypothetical protein Tco_0677524 [Tanacetum coccineum]|uniref:Uncharacterized protein n=1 Tax=Tanacetum coccineum TaxID=301880 RepID=A0ABQ4XD44_9ASTR